MQALELAHVMDRDDIRMAQARDRARFSIEPTDLFVAGVLAGESVVRVAFRDGEGTYLIPLGYVWRESALYGVTEPGRKTRLAAVTSQVSFQVDTAVRTGLFEWESVTGSGRFELVGEESVKREALDALLALAANAPAWWRDEQGSRMESGDLLVWRIRPERMTGIRWLFSTELPHGTGSRPPAWKG